MVQINRFAVALAFGSASAVPRFNLPAEISEALSKDFAFLQSLTLPGYGGASSTSANGYGGASSTTPSVPTLPGYGGSSSSTSVVLSPTKSATSGASKSVSSIVSSGGSKPVSSIVSSGASKPVSTIVTSVSSSSTTGVSIGPVTGTTKIPATGSSPAGTGSSTKIPATGSSPAGSGSAPVATGSSSSSGSSSSKIPATGSAPAGSSSSKTGVSVGPVTGTSKAPATGSSPAGSGTAPVGTGKKSCTKKSKSTILSSQPSKTVSKPGLSGSAPVGTGSSSPSGSSSSRTGVSVGPVTGTSKVTATGSSPAGSGSAPVGTGKKTCTKKSKSTVLSSQPSKTAPKPSASAPKSTGSVSLGRPVSSVASSGRPASSGASSSRPKPPSTTGSSPKPTVSTTSGQVVGYPAPNTTNNVWQYLGIKFGQSPVGDLRFAPPVAYTGTGLINGSTFGDDCACTNLNVPKGLDPRLASLFNTLAQTDVPLSEDCLFVNVWAKANSRNKPVLVWIYGGGFNFGGTNSAAYNGRHFADDEDVIFVSFNYRTNVMGFSGAPNITQNVGLLDQRLAIEWIRDNIAAFGGDPSRITIFGQSAGGASVDLYTFTYYEDPIIAGAIPMSGSANSFGGRTLDQALVSWDNATTNLGCGNSSNTPADTVLACMRQPNITWQAIQDVSKAKPGLNSLLGSFGPTIDDKIVFSNYTERALDGYVAKVPILTGNDNYESGLLSLIAIGAGESYPQSTWDYIDLQVFTCPISRLARYRGDIGIPSWRYYYSGAWPNLVLPTANLTQAWHTSEIPVIFGVSEEITITADTANETALGNYLRGVWSDFAADPLVLDSGKYGWPRYASGSMINLGLNNATVPSFSNASAIEGACQF